MLSKSLPVISSFPSQQTSVFFILYVFVALEIESRRLVHSHVTRHPTADWTLQQLREALPGIVIISSSCMTDMRRSRPVWTKRSKAGVSTSCDRLFEWPTANAHCERIHSRWFAPRISTGPMLHELLIAFADLREWIGHYNGGQPHRALGSGIPHQTQQTFQAHKQTARLCRASSVIAKPIYTTAGQTRHETSQSGNCGPQSETRSWQSTFCRSDGPSRAGLHFSTPLICIFLKTTERFASQSCQVI